MSKHILNPIKNDRYLKQFYDLFLKPYIKTMHPRTRKSMERLVEDFFHAEDRQIVNAVVAERLSLPGGKKVLEDRAVYGIAKPVLPVGTIVTIRMDKTRPNEIEVSFEKDDDEVIYCLTQLQLQYILPKLQVR